MDADTGDVLDGMNRLRINLERRQLNDTQMVFVARPLLEVERKLAEIRMKAGK